MQDLQIKIVSNGWIITNRIGTQIVFIDSKKFIEAVMSHTLDMEARDKLAIIEVVKQKID